MKGLAKSLWLANADLARANLACSFVTDLGNGRLQPSAFKSYIAQDAFFLDAFARAYALALAHAPDQHGVRAFAALIDGVVKELQLHATYAKSLGIDLRRVTPLPATLAYTEFLAATATRGRTGETCAAMTPCMRLYAFLGQSLARRQGGRKHRYSTWIDTYAHPDFESLAGTLEALLDRYGRNDAQHAALYRRAMELELGFFSAATGRRLARGR